MKIGTKSVLFGVHCFFIHPLFVALAWWRIYGCPFDPRLWVAFVVHDWGYWGKPNMDGAEGEQHPWTGAKIMGALFDWHLNFEISSQHQNASGWQFRTVWARRIKTQGCWHDFTLFHSRFLAKQKGKDYSRLCVADKFATAIMPRWLYLLQANLSGEIHEYMQGQGARTPAGERGQWDWITSVQGYLRAWTHEHKDGRKDEWTGTKRDLCREDFGYKK